MSKNKLDLSKHVYMRNMMKALNLRQICGDDASLDRYVVAPDVNRPGLELAGYSKDEYLKRVTILGRKELDFLRTLDENTQRMRLEAITDPYTPCIIVSTLEYGGVTYQTPETLKQVAWNKNFPVFEYDGETYQLVVDLVAYLSERLAITDTIHGVMMNVYGVGVMIKGAPGIGKSELALDLIKRGHMLIADDRVDVSHISHRIYCEAPDILKRMLEIRGVGVIDVNQLFGASAFMNRSPLDFIIELANWDEGLVVDRLNPIKEKETILGLDIQKLVVPVTASKSLSVVIEAAVTDFKLRKAGINTTEIFKQNVMKEIQRKNEEEAGR